MRALQSTVVLFGALTMFACDAPGGGSGGASTTTGSGGTAESSGTTTTIGSTTTSSGPALMPFDCGTATCQGTEYCEMVTPGTNTGGVSASPHYTCHDLPDSCTGLPTCDCVGPQGGGSTFCTCSDDGAGHVTVVCNLA